MSEHLDLPRRERDMTNKAEIAWSYLDALPHEDIEPMLDLSEELRRHGALEPCTVIIPVAAHQEAHNVYHAVSQYARQDVDEPFTVVMHFNSPYPLGHPAIEDSIDQFECARQDFHELDLRMTYRQYDNASIGRIRRDIWNAALHAGVEYGTITDTHDMLGINHDIDLVGLPRHYMRAVQAYQNDTKKMFKPAYTQARHALVPDMPNVSRVIAWSETLSICKEEGFEAAAVIPMAFYANFGGINPSDSKYEIGNLISTSAASSQVPTGRLMTSGRRFAELLHTASLDEIWGSKPFTDTELYRHSDHGLSDISEKRLNQIIKQSTDKTMPQAVLSLDSKTQSRIDAIIQNPNISDWDALRLVYGEHFRRYRLNRNLLDSVMRSCVQAKRFDKEPVSSIYSDGHLKMLSMVYGEINFIESKTKKSRPD